MSGLSWVRATPPESLSVDDLHRVQDLFATETGENYQMANLRKLPISQNAGSLMLISSEGFIEGVLWAMNIDQQTVRIVGFCVASKYQKMGFGKKGWQRFSEIAIGSGRKSVYLEVRANNVGAIKFYRANGLMSIGVLSNYYNDQKGLLMSGDL